MANKIQISSKDASLGILTYRGLSHEQDQGLPANWVRFFIGRDEEEYPDYDRIQYLRNVNIRPFSTKESETPFMPVWHAAVVLLSNDIPTRLLLVSETSILDDLVSAVPPMPLIEFDYPMANVTAIRVDLDDEEEEPEYPKVNLFNNQHVDIFRGWPSKEYQQQYLKTKEQLRAITEASDKTSSVTIDYRMATRQFEMDLHFEYCLAGDRQLILVLNDILIPEEAW